MVADDLDDWNPRKNPAFSYCEAKCWLALREGRIVLHESVDSIRDRTNGSVDQLFREMFRTQLWNGGEENVR